MKNGERGEDGRRVRRGNHLPPHRYIRNTSKHGTAPIEHPLTLAEDLRPPKRQKTLHVGVFWVGQKKKEKTVTKE